MITALTQKKKKDNCYHLVEQQIQYESKSYKLNIVEVGYPSNYSTSQILVETKTTKSKQPPSVASKWEAMDSEDSLISYKALLYAIQIPR